MNFELTWKPDARNKTSGRWCKVIYGKTHYFGRGNNKDDRDAYEQSLKSYRQFLDPQEPKRQRGQRGRRVGVVTSMAKVEAVVQADLQHAPESPLSVVTTSRRMQKKDATKNKAKRPISEQITQFVEYQERRHRAGEISESRFGNIKRHVTAFKNHLNGHSWSTEDDGSNEQLFHHYRAAIDDLLAEGKMAEAYHSDRLEVLKRFVKWAFEERHLSRLPSNLDRICKRKQRTVNPNPFTIEQVRNIWNSAANELRCYMILALNCGYYAADISTIEELHLKGDYLIKPRQKTKRHGVIMKHLLWDVTRTLIENQRVECEGSILRSPKGGLLVKGRKDRCRQSLRPVLTKLGIEGKSFASFRDTGASIISAINPGLRELYLGHKDRTQAAYYVGDIDEVMGDEVLDSPLDSAIEKLEKILRLQDIAYCGMNV